MNSQFRVKLQVWLAILLVFGLGAITGASLSRVYFSRAADERSAHSRKPGEHRGGRMAEMMKKDLNLSDEQDAAIRRVFEESRKRFSLDDCPGFKESREQTQALVRAVLTPEQQKRYDEIRAVREARMKSEPAK
jgi:Spy/CpxP family protein refolding chaperone